MKTDDLVTMLASGAGAVETDAVSHRLLIAVACGASGAALLMAMLLGVRADLGTAVAQPMFWVKLGYVACLAAAALFVLARVSRPGSRVGAAALALAAPLVLIWFLGGIELANAGSAADRSDLLFGRTWRFCPLLIALLCVPAFIGAMWAVKGLAPTRLRLAGGAAGFAAGAIAAVVYALHCPEMGAPFLGLWYLFGMLIPAAVGALAGPRLLRW